MEQQDNVKQPSDLKGYAVAYVSHHGPAQFGYLGRLTEDKGGIATLEEAIEFVSVQQPQPHGGVMRTAHGMALEMTSVLRTVRARYYALISLDALGAGEDGVYRQAMQEAEQARGSLKQTRGDNLVKPVPVGNLVGLDGKPVNLRR